VIVRVKCARTDGRKSNIRAYGMSSATPNSEIERHQKTNPDGRTGLAVPDEFNSSGDPALLGFLSARYYRREALEHFLNKSHEAVPLSISPPWSAKILAGLFLVALITTICDFYLPIDVKLDGTLLAMEGRSVLAIPSSAPVSVGTPLSISGIAGDVTIVSIECARRPSSEVTQPGMQKAVDGQTVVLNRGPLPNAELPVAVHLKAVRLITVATKALQGH
jgi:hypothetical protein